MKTVLIFFQIKLNLLKILKKGFNIEMFNVAATFFDLFIIIII